MEEDYNEKKNKVKQGIQLGGIFLILMAVTLFIPGVELVTLFVAPIPFVVFASRYNLKSSLIFGLIVMMITFVVTPVVFIVSLPLTVMAILAGTMIGQTIYSKRHPYETWVQGTLGFTMGLTFLFFLLESMPDFSLIGQIQAAITESLSMSQMLLEPLGLAFTADELIQLEQQMLMYIDLLPTVFIFIATAMAFITQWISYKVLNGKTSRRLGFPPFYKFKLHQSILWIYFLSIIIGWFGLDPTSTFSILVFNVTTLLGILFSLQGFSFVLYYTHVKKKPKIIAILIIVFSIIFLPVGLYLMRMLGIIDIGFMLRKKLSDHK